jgi:L-threonylcarbamoyladenylate synthase|tara:strand:+ start:174 stop:788 length:615 start_codon:yes stop_codon:yes gene_type:complete
MKIISPNSEGIKEAVKKILEGEIIFIPTDTVYGIAASPYNNKAIKKIFSIKKRSMSNSLVLLCSNYKMAKKYAIFNKIANNLKKKFWPGPLTLILKKKSGLKISKKWLSKNNSIGIRIPDHNVPIKIIEKCNFPIFCTSANISSKKSCRNIKDIVKNFKNKKVTIINDGKTKFGLDSTIIDVTKNKINILRNGYINKKKLKKFD